MVLKSAYKVVKLVGLKKYCKEGGVRPAKINKII